MNDKNFDYEKHAYCYIDINPNDKSHGAYIHLNRIAETIQRLPSNAKLLDYGCGAGAILRGIKKIRPDLQLYGADLSSVAIKQAQEGSRQDISYKEIKGEKLPFEDTFFDCVIMLEVLEHVPDPNISLHEIKRVLKSNAIYFLAVPQEKSTLTLQGILIKLFNFTPSRETAGHLHFWTEQELSILLNNHNFHITNQTYSQHYLWQIIGLTYMLVLLHTKKQTQELSQHLTTHNTPLAMFGQSLISFLILLTNLESLICKNMRHGLDIQFTCLIQK